MGSGKATRRKQAESAERLDFGSEGVVGCVRCRVRKLKIV